MKKIVSGGQTGVDRAALDVAIAHGIEHGGWCPRGRLAEDGIIDPKYGLVEAPTERLDERTELNVRDSDGTLVLTPEPAMNDFDGTGNTIRFAKALGRPVMVADPGGKVEEVRRWLLENEVEVLNIAGPRESTVPGVYDVARHFIERIASTA